MKKLALILMIYLVVSGCKDDLGNAEFAGDIVGTGGSMARFAIHGDYLYVVNASSINVFDISNEKTPVFEGTTEIGWGVETIFGYKGNLFIGSQTGMFIYSIDENGAPQFLSNYTHQTACDPVIANDEYAYVTIRSGESCGTGLFEANQLITINVSDLTRPQMTSQQQMINPRGLCFFKGDLFVAEGNNGLKKFSLENPADPTLLEYYDDIAANDMIALESTMIITRDEGIYQFGYENEELLLLGPIR